MTDICSACGNFKNLLDAREDHVDEFLRWIDEQDICLRRLGEEEVLDSATILQQHVDEIREEEEEEAA